MSIRSFPDFTEAIEAGKVVLAKVTSNTGDLRDVLHAALDVADYAASMIPSGVVPPPTPIVHEATDLQTALENFTSDDHAKRALAIPWGIILPLLLTFIQRLLGK